MRCVADPGLNAGEAGLGSETLGRAVPGANSLAGQEVVSEHIVFKHEAQLQSEFVVWGGLCISEQRINFC